jgi:hypothetical protein
VGLAILLFEPNVAAVSQPDYTNGKQAKEDIMTDNRGEILVAIMNSERD